MKPEISVIVPIYNSENYLTKCIESILAQSMPDIEIILVNDGSTDNSKKICDDFAKKDSRIRIINQKNEGLSSARNKGIVNSKCEYIMFCDSDDIVSPNWCKNLIALQKKYPDLLPFCPHTLSAEDLGKEMECVIPTNSAISYKDILKAKNIGFGYAWNKIFKKSIIQEHDLKFRTWKAKNDFNEDIVFTMNYIEYCSGFIVGNHADYCYFIRDNSLSRGNKQPVLERHIEKYNLLKSYILKYCQNDKTLLNDIANTALYHFMLFFIAESKKHSLKPTKNFINYMKSEILKDILSNITQPSESKKIMDSLRRQNILELWIILKLKNK